MVAELTPSKYTKLIADLSAINNQILIPDGQIEQTILLIRGHRVMLDSDLARVYGVTTKRLNEQVKRNHARFPDDFMFQLTADEKGEVVAYCDHLARLKFSPYLPFAFTEHGTVMLASILDSPIAVAASIHVVRAFVRLREIVATHQQLARKLALLEKKYDGQFKRVFTVIRRLMKPKKSKTQQIGFKIIKTIDEP